MRVTRRERDVLRLLLRGKTNNQIAETLNISGYTVRDHVSSLLKKSGVKTRMELMVEHMPEEASQNKKPPTSVGLRCTSSGS